MEISNVLDYNPAMPKIIDEQLLELTGLAELDFANFCKSVQEEAKLTKAKMAETLGITVRAYEMLIDTKKDKDHRPKPSVDTFIGLLLIRANTRSLNLKAIFL